MVGGMPRTISSGKTRLRWTPSRVSPTPTADTTSTMTIGGEGISRTSRTFRAGTGRTRGSSCRTSWTRRVPSTPRREEYKREGREDDDVDLSPLIENLLTREEVFSEDMNEVWTADSLWAEIRGVLQGEMDEKARLREELERLEIEKEKAKM